MFIVRWEVFAEAVSVVRNDCLIDLFITPRLQRVGRDFDEIKMVAELQNLLERCRPHFDES